MNWTFRPSRGLLRMVRQPHSHHRRRSGLRRVWIGLALVLGLLGSVLSLLPGLAAAGLQGIGGTFLWFPFLKGDETSFTGYAITNHGALATNLEFQALASDGELQPYPINPSLLTLGGQEQSARTASQIFGLDLDEPREGWVRLESSRSTVASFFQFGRVSATGYVSELDGAVAATELSKVLYFTRIVDGPLTYPSLEGGESAVQTLYLANPNTQSVQVLLEVVDPVGQPFVSTMRTLPAGGCLAETFSSLFNVGPVSDGFVRVTSSTLGIAGFETIELDGTILGLNPGTGNSALVSYSAQLAHGQSGDSRIFTWIKLINTSNSPVALTLTALNENGSVLNVASNIVLDPNQALQRDVGEIFSLGPPTAPQLDGSIRVEATGPGVLGDVIFGDPDSGRYAAALPLQSRLFTRAIFSQVANISQGNAHQQFFTGLAFHNPGTQTSRVTIKVYQENGNLTGSTFFDMPAGTRRSDLLADLVKASANQARGYILVESTRPLVAQQLFGNFALDFLSAVPPTILQ